MIECVTWATEHRFSEYPITQQFNLRYHSSILQHEWSSVHVNPSEVTGGFEECDQYDTRYTEYLIKRNEKGQILGTIRTGPTTAPYMLKDHFSGVVSGNYNLPHSAEHHELSRMAVNRELLTREESVAVTNELLLAAQERGLQRGIKAYWGIVIEIVAEKVFRRAGYDVQFTGSPVIFPNTGEHIYGVKLPVTKEIHQRCQNISSISDPILNFGYNRKGDAYPILKHESPILSDIFFKTVTFKEEVVRASSGLGYKTDQGRHYE